MGTKKKKVDGLNRRGTLADDGRVRIEVVAYCEVCGQPVLRRYVRRGTKVIEMGQRKPTCEHLK